MRRHSPPPLAHLLRPPPPLSSPSGGIPRKFARPEAPSRNSSRVSLKFPPFPGFDRTQIRHYVAADSGKKTKSKIQRKSKSRLAKKKKKKKKARLRASMTPMTSKLKKYKIKAYPSFKYRFRTLNDGTMRRWRAGKLHNAQGKSKKSKRRLGKPALVHPAYAKVLKKLNFRGLNTEGQSAKACSLRH